MISQFEEIVMAAGKKPPFPPKKGATPPAKGAPVKPGAKPGAKPAYPPKKKTK